MSKKTTFPTVKFFFVICFKDPCSLKIMYLSFTMDREGQGYVLYCSLFFFFL